jgi:glycosyltransferase involved in cell wall biosynthesis
LLKVAVVTRYFPSSAEPSQGRSAYQTLRVLARHTNLRVYYPNADYPTFLKPRSRSYDKLDASFGFPDVQANYYDYPALPLLSRPINGWMAARTLLPHVRAFAPGIILSYFIYPEGYAALKIARSLAVPVVVKGIGSDINRIGDPISAMLTRTVLRKADFVLTVSDNLRNKTLAMGASPAKSCAIVNGCDHAAFHVRDRLEARRKLAIDPAAQAVVYIGRMDVKKGLRELVDAAASLHTERANLHVYLVGNGPDRPLIDSAIQANNATGYIHAMPGCVFDDVAVWMAAADLVTLPSYMEGCPNVVIEALASGRPVVATNVGGIPEIINGECGLLVPPRDSSALAQALASVLNRTWDANAISALNRRSWEDVAADVLEVFDSLVPTHAAGKQAF